MGYHLVSKSQRHKPGLLWLLLCGSIFIESAWIIYLLMGLDNLVNVELYHFGLQFSYDWASRYWTLLRTALALSGLIAISALVIIAFSFVPGLSKPILTTKSIAAPRKPAEGDTTPNENGRKFRHNSYRKQAASSLEAVVYTCPHCGTAVIPTTYTQAETRLADIQIDRLKEIVEQCLEIGALTLRICDLDATLPFSNQFDHV